MSAEPGSAKQILVAEEYTIHYSDYLNKAFEIAKKHFMSYLGFSLLYILAIYLFSYVPLVGGALTSIMLAGGVIVTLKILRNEPFRFSNFLDGFNIHFTVLFLLGIVSSIMISVGFFFFILPGIYLAISYTFGVHFVVDKKLEFWDALESSRKTITKRFFGFLGFQILVFLILTAPFLAGALLIAIAIGMFAAGKAMIAAGVLLVLVAILIFVVASLFTVPTAIIANTIAFLDIVKQGGLDGGDVKTAEIPAAPAPETPQPHEEPPAEEEPKE